MFKIKSIVDLPIIEASANQVLFDISFSNYVKHEFDRRDNSYKIGDKEFGELLKTPEPINWGRYKWLIDTHSKIYKA